MTTKHTIPAGLVQTGGTQNLPNTPAPPFLDSSFRWNDDGVEVKKRTEG